MNTYGVPAGQSQEISVACLKTHIKKNNITHLAFSTPPQEPPTQTSTAQRAVPSPRQRQDMHTL